MSSQHPFVLVNPPYMILEETTTFSIQYCQIAPEHILCVDVFSVRDSRSLERHLGRFLYRLNSSGQGSLQFSFQENPLKMSADEAVLFDHAVYVESSEPILYPLEIRFIVLQKDDSAVLFEDYFRVYEARADLAKDQKYFEQWITTHPMLGGQPQVPVGEQPIICLISASFRDFDAVGNFIWDGWSLLKRNGFPVEIYSQYCDLHFRPFSRNVRELLVATPDELANRVLFYTYSIYDEHLPEIAALPCKKIAYYHGITDPGQIGDIDDHVKKMCDAGLRDLNRLSEFNGLLANSQSSLREFRRYDDSSASDGKFCDAAVLPPIVSMQSKWAAVTADTSVTNELSVDEKVLLYVGRMFPHKHVEDVIAVFAEYHKQDPLANLFLVGGQHPAYYAFLQKEIEKLPVSCQRKIRFFQTVTQSQLKAIYQSATVFITMTEHEGFCIPVLEAMMFGIPVVAKNETAVPEVLDGSGILINSFDEVSVAESIYKVCYDKKYREQVVKGQAARATDFNDQSLAGNYLAAMQKSFHGERQAVS